MYCTGVLFTPVQDAILFLVPTSGVLFTPVQDAILFFVPTPVVLYCVFTSVQDAILFTVPISEGGDCLLQYRMLYCLCFFEDSYSDI